MNIIPFRQFPKGARNLIIYYAIAEPGIVGMIIFNAYLFLTGYSILEVGAIISGASLITSFLLPLLGYMSDKKINAKYFMMTTEALIGASFILYAIANTAFMILLGRMIFSAAMLFTFASSVYEKELYPKDKLDDIYIWHWLIPSIAGIASYLVALFYFYFFPNIWAMRLYYMIFGFASIFYVTYIYFMLPDLPTYPEKTKIRVSRKFLPAVLASLLSVFSSFFIYGLPFDNIVINYFGSGVWIIIFMAFVDSVISLLSSYIKAIIPRSIWGILPHTAMTCMGLLALAIFILPLFLHNSTLFIAFLILYMIHSLFWPLWHMSFKPVLLSNIPLKLRGTVFSSIMMISRLAMIPLAFIVGVFVTSFGAFSPALLSAIFAFLTVVVLLWIKGK